MKNLCEVERNLKCHKRQARGDRPEAIKKKITYSPSPIAYGLFLFLLHKYQPKLRPLWSF
jgi:hypothetical protein